MLYIQMNTKAHGSKFAAGVLRCALATVGAVGTFLSGAASAASIPMNGKTVDYVGVVDWDGAYVGAVEGLGTCLIGVAYFDPTLPRGKLYYATLLTAKTSGLHVNIDVTQDGGANTRCTVVGVRLVN